jgi:MFS family permease
MFCLGAALFGSMILLPLYWQTVRHESVVDTGLLSSPQGIGMVLVMPLVGRLTDRMGGGPLALFGVILTAVSTIPFGLISAHTSIAYLFGAMLVRGVGMGFSFMPAMTAAYAALHRDELSDATPQMNVIQRVGGSLGTAVLAVVLQREMIHVHSPSGLAAGYGVAFWWSAGMMVVAIVPCLVLLAAERRARLTKAAQIGREKLEAGALAEAMA